MKVIHIDTWRTRDCTLGRLSVDDFHCFTLELPWIGNHRNISCIPEGTYQARHFDSPKHGKVILLGNVPYRTMIEIHAGNYTEDTRGCILVGDGIKYLNNDATPDVTNSKATLTKLLSVLDDDLLVQIVRA